MGGFFCEWIQSSSSSSSSSSLSFLLLMLRGLLEAGDGKPCSCAWNGESACFWKLWRDGWGRGGSR